MVPLHLPLSEHVTSTVCRVRWAITCRSVPLDQELGGEMGGFSVAKSGGSGPWPQPLIVFSRSSMPPPSDAEHDLTVLLGNWVVDLRTASPPPRPLGHPPGPWAPLLSPKVAPQAEPIPRAHSDWQRLRARLSLSPTTLAHGEEWACVSPRLWERGRVCYARSLPDPAVSSSYTSSCLFVRHTLAAAAPAASDLKCGFSPCDSHSGPSGLWQEGFPGIEKPHTE